VIREDAGRLIVSCDRCPVRLDLGLVSAVRQRNRTPSGWLRTGPNTHYCPVCAPHVRSAGAVVGRAGGLRAQPLF
jgi:hypothetical protein